MGRQMNPCRANLIVNSQSLGSKSSALLSVFSLCDPVSCPKSGQRCLRTVWEVKNRLSLASESALAVQNSAGFEEMALSKE